MFTSPFTMCIIGATGSGKTQFLMQFLSNCKKLINPPPAHILYCYGETNSEVLALRSKGIEIFHGAPSEKQIKERKKPLLLLMDDLLLDLKTDFLDRLYTRGSHNWNVSCVLVSQSLFSKTLRVVRSNSHFLVLMRTPASELQIKTLGSQLFAGNTKYFMESYKDATENPFTYLVINMHPKLLNTFG
uniref:AAA+ ATPase domain-containing protein n=1 Tax=Ditylenchus dipsaci TaxID=166011 RepID=A0A915DL52_9BILA